MSLSPPPSRERLPVKTERGETYAEMPRTWIVWFAALKELVSPVGTATGIIWSLINKAGSNLTDLTIRNHRDLQNLDTATHTHLTELNATDLTDGGETILHKHDHNLQSNLQGGANADYSHLTTVQNTDLTDGGDSDLHYHQSDRIHARNHALYRV
jgi:hypothetical protein